MTKKTEKGILAKNMGLEDLKNLAVQLKLLTLKEVSKMKKPEILKVITAWEKKAVKESKDTKTGLRKLNPNSGVINVLETKEEEFYNGKKVLSRTEREINGKIYIDIKVAGGEVFTNLK